MALVVLLRGVNVGGHRTFRPSKLAEALQHLDVVNIGAAGTLVVRRPITQARLRAELSAQLPFAADIAICQGRDIVRAMSEHPFTGDTTPPDVVRFLSVLIAPARTLPTMPLHLPARGEWQLRILATDRRFVFGEYRRNMKAIGYLGTIDRMFGVPATTRSWSTIAAIARVLGRAGR